MTTVKVPLDGYLREVELLPCPFCGSQPKCNGMPRGMIGQIYCANDDCFGPRTTAICKSDSVAQWNKRPTIWQPIETAPRDGRAIHIFVPENRPDRQVLTGYFQDEQWWICSGSIVVGKPTRWRYIDKPKAA